jgi:DNA replication and repair protein RecF
MHLALRRYRNLEETDLKFGPGFNILWGKNAQGKTNLLEAIYLLGHLKSFRNARGREIILHGSETASAVGLVDVAGVKHRVELLLELNGRTPRVNGKTVKKLSDFLGYLRPILFTPEEMALVKGYPSGRRTLLDRAIVQKDPLYLDRVQEFSRILRQRNQLLKNRTGHTELEPWNQALASSGSRIRLDRLEYLEEFLPLFKQVYRKITNNDEKSDISYPIVKKSLPVMTDDLYRELDNRRQSEWRLGQTLAGPHRDDPDFLIEERALRTFGSQGQQRSFLLAFKAAQVISLEELLGEPPVLLLDDLTSELDVQRQKGFFDFLLARKGQVFITTTRPEILKGQHLNEARFFEVTQGKIKAN